MPRIVYTPRQTLRPMNAAPSIVGLVGAAFMLTQRVDVSLVIDHPADMYIYSICAGERQL